MSACVNSLLRIESSRNSPGSDPMKTNIQSALRQSLFRSTMNVRGIAIAALTLALATISSFAQTTILSETFEGSFPSANAWSVGDANASGTTAYWDDVDSAFGGEGTHGGSWKGYCAAVGYAGTTTSPLYRDYMSAYMSKSITFQATHQPA